MNYKAAKEVFFKFLDKYDFGKLFQFSLTNGIIWMLMSLVYLKYINLQKPSTEGLFYSIVFGIGHMGAYSFGLWIILQLLRFCGNIFSRIMAVFLGGMLTFFLFSDIVVYVLYRFHINIPMLSLFCSPAAFELVEVPFLMALMILGVIAVIYTGEYFLLKGVSKFRFYKSFLAFFLVIILSWATFNSMHAWAAFSGKHEILIRTDALPLKYALTASRFFIKRGFKPAPQTQVSTGSCINYPLAELQFDPPAKRKNILFILVDSLRADMFTPEIMPYTYQLSETLPSNRFLQNYSGGNCTKMGVFSLFYGISGNYFDQALRSSAGAAMIDSMLKLGYDVKIFSSGTLISPPFNRTIFVNVPNLELQQTGKTKVDRDNECFRKCVDYLEKRDPEKPYFILLFLDAVHGPSIPDDFKFKFETPMRQLNYLTLDNSETTKKNVLNLMKNGALYMDQVLGNFFKKINIEQRIRKDTVLFITSDHGNEVAETEMCNWGHGSNFARQQLQTPLVIFGLDRPKQTISYRTSSLDISATIMQDILGCKNPVSDYSAGQNLFDPTERKFIFSSGYLENTIIYEDKVFVQTAYGAMQKYTLDGKFINDPLPPGAAKKFFDMMKNYSK